MFQNTSYIVFKINKHYSSFLTIKRDFLFFRSQNSIVKSQSMSRRGITTARSPWINRRGIQISEWDI